ncbi:SPOR domain-containing protein [Thiorhodovibrio frisius]|uniref:SPOR domain-containing protein n=1 Tax=Thiorhodovibrio frisius TaxID=631362 RepID=H8Z4W1_9GAMM|nr:SPOR domain-containing protein [Thiorhodovibrio frisius]EIC20368.1 hypothetical protein Thi970DRAFT_03997 [Thiorhodovibrio frisius]WPL21108.1 hypothetical protein Thiofri_01216 [Thiorhodovibrio frisius]
MPTQTLNATTFFRTIWPLLALGFLIAIAPLGQTRAADPGWRPGWFVILGSLPETQAGLNQAHLLAGTVERNFPSEQLIVSETAFYRGLTPGLYVVMLGPYPSAAAAQRELTTSGLKELVPDAYVKQASERVLE